MGREKKVTVKAYANKMVEPRIREDGKMRLYPLYFQITYNRKTTRIQGGNKWLTLSQEAGLVDDPFVNDVSEAINKIVRFEVNQDESFEIKGIGVLLRYYASFIKPGAYLVVVEAIREELREKLTHEEFDEWRYAEWQDRPGENLNQLERGLELLGENITKEIAELARCKKVVDEYVDDSLTVYDWVIEGERKAGGASVNSFSVDVEEDIYKIVFAIYEHGAYSPLVSKSISYNGLVEMFRIDM